MRVGLVVNPIAGMGGAVGLKGTDGEAIKQEAIDRGAKRVSPARAEEALKSVKRKGLDIEWLTCAGEMGEIEMISCGLVPRIVYQPTKDTSSVDTTAAVRLFLENGASLVVFAGGDGTARDISGEIDRRAPILGIPAGVKMQSAVFVNRPDDLGDVLMTFLGTGVTKEAEVMDVNEDAFREGVVEAKLYGIALVPDDSAHLQMSKMSYHSGSADDEVSEIGQFIVDSMEKGVLYIIGPGSTTASIAGTLGQEKTLLGVDVYLDRRLVKSDASEKDLARLLDSQTRAKIVVSPIGGQGFVFGRGNQQLSPEIIRRVGAENIVVVAGPTKIRGLKTLRVDTGSSDIDRALRGKTKVVTGYKRKKLVEVK